MRRRVSASAIAAASAICLFATACGGVDESPDDVLPDIATGSSASSETEGDEVDDEVVEGGVERPEINLPEDVNNVFEGLDTDDPVERAVLADQQRGIDAVDEAVTSGDPDVPSLRFYLAGSALHESADYILGMHENGRSFGGTTRYYNRTVEMHSDIAAVTTYCVDASAAYLVHLDSGEQVPEVGTYYYMLRQELAKNDSGRRSRSRPMTWAIGARADGGLIRRDRETRRPVPPSLMAAACGGRAANVPEAGGQPGDPGARSASVVPRGGRRRFRGPARKGLDVCSPPAVPAGRRW